MKVLHLIGAFNPGGIERWLIGILPYINNEQTKADFFCRVPDKGVLSDLVEAQGAKIYVHRGGKLNLQSYSTQLKQIIKENDYDIVHNHLSIHAGLPAMALAKLGVPSIVSFHNAHFAPLQVGNKIKRILSRQYANFSLQKATSNAALVTACSADVMKGIGEIVPLTNCDARILHYGVDVPEYAGKIDANYLKQEINIPEGHSIVVHVGRFNPQKNHKGFLKIAESILRQRKNTTFVMIGDGHLREEIEQKAKELNIHSSFRFLGFRKDVEKILNCADVFLFPSLWEGLPVAALEAMAAGLPIVGANTPGVKMAVKDGITGYLCELDDINRFTDTVIALLDDSKLRTQFGSKAHEIAIEKFSHAASSKSLISLYEEVI